LQTANLPGTTASYPDILLQGFESVLLRLVVLPLIFTSISCLIPLVFNFLFIRFRLADVKRWILFGCEMALFFGATYLSAVRETAGLVKGEHGLLLLRPDAKGSDAFSLNCLTLWTVFLLAIAALGYFEWRYAVFRRKLATVSAALRLPTSMTMSEGGGKRPTVRKETALAVKHALVVLGVLWVVFQMAIFARACGVVSLQEFGVAEIRIQERTQPSLDGARVFLLGQTADRYVLLTIKDKEPGAQTIKEPDAQRAIVMVRNDELPVFNMVGWADVFHNPVRSKP
jgi:hypothetical protein